MMQSLTAALLFNTAAPSFPGATQRTHLMDDRAAGNVRKNGTNEFIRKSNLKKVLEAINGGCTTLLEIIDETGISEMTVKRIVSELSDIGTITTRRGKPHNKLIIGPANHA